MNIAGVNKMIRMVMLALVLALPVMALAEHKDVKQWSDGPLAWSDFRGTSVIDGINSYLKTNLSTDVVKDADSKKFSLAAVAEMWCDHSFADASKCDAARLRYHQLQFDLLEIYRRRLQSDLSSGMNGIEAEHRLKYYQNLYSERLDKLDQETDCGRNDHKLQEWEYFTRKELDEMGLPAVPEISFSPFTYGVFGGIGGLFPTSSISDDFSGCFTFTAGLNLGFDRLRLKSDITYGQPNFNNGNIFAVKDDQGRDIQGNVDAFASCLGIGLSLGYSIINLDRFSLTPHAGCYWNSYGWKVNNYEWKAKEGASNPDGTQAFERYVTSVERANVKSFGWMAGIDFDIKLHKFVSNTPFFLTNQREEFSSAIRITPYVAHAKFDATNPGVKGYQVGISVCYSGMARSLKIK